MTARRDGMCNFSLSHPNLGAAAHWCVSVLEALRSHEGAEKMRSIVHFAGSAQGGKKNHFLSLSTFLLLHNSLDISQIPAVCLTADRLLC